VVHDLERDHGSVRDGVETPMKGSEVQAIEVRDPVLLPEVRR
jgi:hypothetical protein